MAKKIIYSLILLLIIMHVCYAETYYADLNIVIEQDGVVEIAGTTNDPKITLGKTDYLTSKKGPYWLFNLSSPNNYSTYFVSVEFPKGTEINFIKVKGGFRIVEETGIKIITTGENIPLEIAVQYKLEKNNNNNPFFIVGGIGLLLLAAFLFIGRQVKFKKIIPDKKEQSKDNLKLLKNTLTDNQRAIVDILVHAKEPITQKQLFHRTKLPKATLSRNIKLLEEKNIIVKQPRGMVNVIFLKEEFLK
ncbi:MAG: MarR family transcriptional regulator [archaeon]